MYGGNGNDTIYGSYKAGENAQTSTFAGQGGKDLIRTDIYEDAFNQRSYTVFGDWGYGAEGDSYTST